MRDVSDGEYWDLEIQKVHRGEDGLAAIVDTGITPRERLDEIEKTFFPAKGRDTPAPVISVEMLEADYAGYVLSFDGAAKPSTRQGSCGCVIWKLPGWRIPTAQGFLLEDATVNRVMQAVTRSHARDESDQYVPRGPVEYQAERWRRIKAHQDSDPRLSELKKFLKGEFDEFSRGRIKKVSKPVEPYVLDARDVLYRLSCSTEGLPRNMSDKLRLVVSETLRSDMFQYAHEDYQGGHQGITRTHEKLRSEFYWYGMYADVENFVKECADWTVRVARGDPRARDLRQTTLSRGDRSRWSR
ncbi:hypothetical protein PC110_g18828 [Phytophthora cactorum]|uniref:Integrase zinc-binding domain-containing protein n=1 Tax=Phytophthora cactorum TaxID=29920 RepID=A0A329RNT1_9STRA|nr:hypothetical protein PC117_g16630 [Phytophthora cactorum]RAW24748.1 hypothetical protein PC110_g18828 [Phytophthora cactorum]